MLTIPITSKISIESRARQKRVMNIKDTRIKVENEVLGGMKIIKLYAWEQPFLAKITATRDRELSALWNYQLLQVSARPVWAFASKAARLSRMACGKTEAPPCGPACACVFIGRARMR